MNARTHLIGRLLLGVSLLLFGYYIYLKDFKKEPKENIISLTSSSDVMIPNGNLTATGTSEFTIDSRSKTSFNTVVTVNPTLDTILFNNQIYVKK